MSRIRRNKTAKTLKDYIVPIIWFVFIIIIIINSTSSSSTSNNNSKTNENSIWIEINTSNNETQAYIIYPGDSKKKIEWNAILYKWEKILVKEWSLEINSTPNAKLILNRLWELKYNNDWVFTLKSSDLWINTKSNFDINMSYATINISENSILSLSQNEVWSTIYLLKWKIEVNNLVWKSTMLTGGQKITVSRKNASDNSIDLSIQKDTIDNFFKSSDWFIKNWWENYLIDKIKKSTDKSWTWKISVNNSRSIISITSFKDEERVTSSTIDIEWNYKNSNVSIITVNGKTTKINTDTKTFSYKNFNLENNINDIIVKVYDTDRNIIWKKVYTLYLWKTLSNKTSSSWFKVKTFALDASWFKFTSPSTSWEFTTYATFVTIKWIVPKWLVSKVVVNDYKLNSFNWVSWRYHARTDYNNLKKWTNIYEIKYYKKDGSLLYVNNYIIIKKVKWSAKKIISDEAKVN